MGTMKSPFVQGLIGFIIVMSVLVGGTEAAGACHDLLTKDIPTLYMFWLWVCWIPFWWLCWYTLARDRMERSVAEYLWLLPPLMLNSLLIDGLGPLNPWVFPAIIAGLVVHAVVRSAVQRLGTYRPSVGTIE
jgi:hypothetical protein